MAVIVRRISPDSYIWTCTKCGTSGSGTTEGAARAAGSAHSRSAHK